MINVAVKVVLEDHVGIKVTGSTRNVRTERELLLTFFHPADLTHVSS